MVGEGATPFEDKSDVEKRADTFAAEFLIDRPQIEHFIRRYRPLFSKQKIRGFAAKNWSPSSHSSRSATAPKGSLIGRISREMLAKVREIAVSTTLTDGFWPHCSNRQIKRGCDELQRANTED